MKDRLSVSRRPAARIVAVAGVAAAILAGCSQTETVFPEDPLTRGGANKGSYEMVRPGETTQQSIFGQGGLDLFGGGDDGQQQGGTGIGVNAWLWRATLDTVSFMPLVSADPFGGVVITDWYADPATPGERFKTNVFILGRELRADGVKASVFRQVRDPATGGWTDAPVAPGVATELEDAVLMRARQLRMASAEG